MALPRLQGGTTHMSAVLGWPGFCIHGPKRPHKHRELFYLYIYMVYSLLYVIYSIKFIVYGINIM